MRSVIMRKMTASLAFVLAALITACSASTETTQGGDDQASALQSGGAAACSSPDMLGNYCGGSEGGVPGGDVNSLYYCSYRGAELLKKCKGGCTSLNGHGVCNDGSTPVCANPETLGNFCGGAIHGAADTLYKCSYKGAEIIKKCSSGCATGANYGEDDCKADPNLKCLDKWKKGYFCGNHLGAVSGGSPSSLYYCGDNGAIQVSSVCGNGCVIAGASGQDRCR